MENSTHRARLEEYLTNQVNRTLIDHYPEGVFALDHSGCFVRLNRACEEITGYSFDTLLNCNYHVLSPFDGHKVDEHFQKALNGELQNYDTTFLNIDDEKVYVNITNIPINVDNEILGVFGIAKDISSIKYKQLELVENEEIHRFLTENSLDIITQTDTDGHITYVSPASKSILGYTPEELIGAYSGDIIHEEDVNAQLNSFKSLLEGEKYVTLTFRAKHKEGHYIWMEAHSNPKLNPHSGHVEAVISVIRDISERVAKEETYKGIIKNSPDAIFIANDNVFLFMNDQFIELLDAKNKEEVIQRGFFSIIPPEYLEVITDRIEMVKKGLVADYQRMKIKTLIGREKQIETKVIPTLYQNKPARHVIIRDITERLKTQELLLKSEKLSVAGQLAAGIAHEVRNPLTSIRGFIQLLERLYNDHNDYFRIIYTEIDRINQILSELLTLAKPQDTHFGAHDLFTLVEQVKVLLGTQATMNNIIIETLFSNDHPITITCDENQLKQVFINFIKNSIEAMPVGGKIIIKVSSSEEKVKLSFIDQGTGIPEDILGRIGEPFFTTKPNGTGLGLMISKQIIENHKGELNIQSSPQGTTIEVILPIRL